MNFEETSVQEMEKKLRLGVPTTHRKFKIRETVLTFQDSLVKLNRKLQDHPHMAMCEMQKEGQGCGCRHRHRRRVGTRRTCSSCVSWEVEGQPLWREKGQPRRASWRIPVIAREEKTPKRAGNAEAVLPKLTANTIGLFSPHSAAGLLQCFLSLNQSPEIDGAATTNTVSCHRAKKKTRRSSKDY